MRVRELDAVRGLAAVTVVLGHCAIAFPVFAANTRADGLTLVNVLKYTPLQLLFDGFPAVMVFFVLSGFVLTLQLAGAGRQEPYGAFLIRRVCRIWLPYAAAVVLAMVVCLPFVAEPNPQFSYWYGLSWTHAPGLSDVVSHGLLIGDFDNDAYDPVLWSLVHEMRISLVFPLILAASLALGPARSAVAGLAVALAGYVAGSTLFAGTDYFQTLQYLLCFIAGIQLAVHREALTVWVDGLRTRRRAALWTAAVLTLAWRAIIPRGALPAPLARLYDLTIVDVTVSAVGAGLIVLLAQSAAPRRVLLRRVPQFLGRISYSLYLVHAIVLLAMLHLAADRSTATALLPLVIVVSVGLATAMQRAVEGPAQRLGRRLTTPRAERRPPVAV